MDVSTPLFQPEQLLGYREILLRKLTYSVTSSVLSQVLILLIYLFAIKFDILHPVEWVALTFKALVSVSTWIFVTLFLSVIFAQCVLCAKDYIFQPIYCSTRMKRFISVFSIRNTTLLLLHIVSGCLGVWLLMSQTSGKYSSLIVTCEHRYCISDGMFYLLCAGIWQGLYYFIKIYNRGDCMVFPIVQQRKLLRFKVRLFALLKESYYAALMPCIYFLFVYYIWGPTILLRLASLTKLHVSHSEPSLSLYVYMYVYGGWFYFNMGLMRYYFELFLTEPIQFSITDEKSDCFTLADALTVKNIPIIQHLASLDLYGLTDDKFRRSALFLLSQPGGHPRNWNKLSRSTLHLINQFTDSLNKSTNTYSPEKSPEIQPCQPSCLVTSPRYTPIRNMTMLSDCFPPTTSIAVQPQPSVASVTILQVQQRLAAFVENFKEKTGINYFFGDLPEANIQSCLGDGQMIIWCMEGMAFLTTASLLEDRYGIVQKDLPIIVSSLVELKMAMDRLNRIPALSARGHKCIDFYCKMKLSINNAVKRSLYQICCAFKDHMTDIPLKKEYLVHLQAYLTK